MKYRILEHLVYDEYCKVERTYYTIEELVPVPKLFGGGEKWKALKHRVCYGHDVHTTVTEFKTSDDAALLIVKLLEGLPRDTVVSKVII